MCTCYIAQAVILGCLSAGVLPQDPSGLYYLISSPEVAQKGFCSDYCGWHDVWPNNLLCAPSLHIAPRACSTFCPACVAHALTNASAQPSSAATCCVLAPCCSPWGVVMSWLTSVSCMVCARARGLRVTACGRRYGFVGSTLRCPTTCQVQTVGPNGASALDGVASILAHEIAETITDPYTDAWCAPRAGLRLGPEVRCVHHVASAVDMAVNRLRLVAALVSRGSLLVALACMQATPDKPKDA